MVNKVLVTGGAGFIGSCICCYLEEEGIVPIILDNFTTGTRDFVKGKIFYEGDIADDQILSKIMTSHPNLKTVIHCAARACVPESAFHPLLYYRENVSKSLSFIENWIERGGENIIFSSSGSIYGEQKGGEVAEDCPLVPVSPYARTKLAIEHFLQDLAKCGLIKVLSLRYFNPIGADPSLRTGRRAEDKSQLLCRLLAVFQGETEFFTIAGTNWNTRDGSGLRDYLHVWDVAHAHVLAVKNFSQLFRPQENYKAINLGVGQGITVREFLGLFEKVVGQKIKVKEIPARPGDIAGSYASCKLAKEILKWEAKYNVEDAIRDAISWRSSVQRGPI